MKLLMAIVQEQDLPLLQDDLTQQGFRMTKLASTGGFLKSGNATLLIGLDEDKVQDCLDIIKANCQSRKTSTSMVSVSMPADAYIPYPMEIIVGGATVFIVDVVDYLRF